MLILSRKESEEIRIGDTVVIRIAHIGHGRVKLGIEAPPSVRVLRGEVAQTAWAISPSSLAEGECQEAVSERRVHLPLLDVRRGGM